MQVATLFRETAKLLGASMEGSGMDTSKYCMKSESQADDGYETCVDVVCSGNTNAERMMGSLSHLDSANMRHLGMGDNRQSIPTMKLEQYGDPYSFVDEMPNAHITSAINPANNPSQGKKRGRRKKSESKREEIQDIKRNSSGRDEIPMDSKERKRQERFNGLSEEEVTQRTLPDHLSHNLDVVIIGINPGLFAAFKGHHYAGPGNHFWKCLYLSGLVPEPMTSDDDYNLLRYGIGFTNMVARPTKGSADLTRREIKQGSQILLEKLQKYRPKVAVFNGKLIYEVFSGKKDFPFGRQTDFVEGTNTYIWVMPSSSARCAQLPRAADKVPFYTALKKFRDYLNGIISDLDDSEVVFNETSKITKGTNNESSKFLGSASSPYDDDTSGSNIPVKKKRGRPRKGMEKHNLNGTVKPPKKNTPLTSESKIAELERKCMEKVGSIGLLNGVDNNRKAGRPVKEEVPRKRRGRPKKTKVLEESPPNRSMGSNTPDVLENSAPSSIGTCHTQTASSVSSGYSTATTVSNEDRRREENGSLSNAGSGGPSPSHHSFTTQSDLSSEISAAISCGSAPPSPLNNQTENVFDGLSVVNHLRDESQAGHNSKLQMPILQVNHNHSSTNCNPPGSLYPSSGLSTHSQSVDSHESSYIPFHHPYDSRLHSLNNSARSQNYQPPNPRDGGNDGGMQQTRSSYHSPYETKSLDVASKSLSGLESLVDQIPSIADSDVVGPSVSSGACLSGLVSDSISHSQSMCALPSVTSSMSHSGHGHYGEAPSGFLPYGHGNPSSYSAASHYTSSPYYASELSSSFPVNSLGPTYCTPPPSSGIMFGYPSYHGQYGSSPATAGYPHSSSASLHLPPSSYGSAPNYSSTYPGPSTYPHGHPMATSNGSSGQRFTQRLHLRQEGMDLGHMGFGGF